MNEWLRIYLPLFIIVYLLIAFVLPSIRTFRQTGINPLVFGKTDNAHDFIGRIMKLLSALPIVFACIYAMNEDVYQMLVPVSYLQKNVFQFTGLVMIHLSLVWIIVAQYQMKNAWRIGIDEKNKTTLVTHGLFSISRNPVFAGMLVSAWGLFLVLPNILSFFSAACTHIILQIQIRMEEAHLSKQHGIVYEAYKSKVRRIL